MTAKKKTSKSTAGKNDGKGSMVQTGSKATSKKIAVKYTLWRKKEDVANIEKLKRILKAKYGDHVFNTDSEIYKKIPELYSNAVKKNQVLQLAIDELTAKLDQLEDLRTCFCRIFEICEMKK